PSMHRRRLRAHRGAPDPPDDPSDEVVRGGIDPRRGLEAQLADHRAEEQRDGHPARSVTAGPRPSAAGHAYMAVDATSGQGRSTWHGGGHGARHATPVAPVAPLAPVVPVALVAGVTHRQYAGPAISGHA